MEIDDSYAINGRLSREIDANWQNRIETVFVPEHPRDIDTQTGRRVLKAIERNLKVATEIRNQFIDTVPFVSYDLAEEAYAALDKTGEPFTYATEHRTIISVRDHAEWIYPAFQFMKAEAGLKVIQTVQEQFVDEPIDWAVVSWWMASHPRLDGYSPEEVFRLRPSLVMLTMRSESSLPEIA